MHGPWLLVHRWSLFLCAGPCLQYLFDDGDGKEKEKKKKDGKRSYWPSDVKDRFLIICVYIFIYLIIYWRVLRPERRSRHRSLLQVLRRVATSQNSDWAKRQRLIHFSLFFFFVFFFLPMIFNTKCSKTETLCTCASRGNSCQSRPRRGFFLCQNAVYATPIGTSGLHPGEEEEFKKRRKKKPLWSKRRVIAAKCSLIIPRFNQISNHDKRNALR